MKKIIFGGIFLLIPLFFFSCSKKISDEEQFEKEVEEIKSYLKSKGLEAKQTSSGLFYVVEVKGTGNHPKADDNVRVRYKGYKLDEQVFDESPSEGISFNLQYVIKGWTEGIPKFREGGKGMLLLPSKLGYGKQGTNGIPPYTTLIFDVELLTIE